MVPVSLIPTAIKYTPSEAVYSVGANSTVTAAMMCAREPYYRDVDTILELGGGGGGGGRGLS